jgi:hypothetical protein
MRLTMLLPLLFACTGTSKESNNTADDSSSTEDTQESDLPACDPMTAGEDWTWEGQCPQMPTPCEVQVEACSIIIGYSSGMTMDMPRGGEISGNTITFIDSGIAGCVGTLEDADHVTGSCDSGCTFTLYRPR